MNRTSQFTRRTFIKSAAIAVPTIVSPSSLGLAGTVSPSNRITLGLVGCGLHGSSWNLDQVFRNDDSEVIAVCDVDRERLGNAKAKVDAHYTRKFGRSDQGCTVHDDFRDLINRSDIDAVINCTPDHWHVIPAIMAAKTGKDVICEKPLTLTIAEGRTLCNVIEQTGRIFQTASENRSLDTYIRLCELVRNGRIGKLQHIRVTLPQGNESRGANFNLTDVCSPPEGFNYEMWQGQAPLSPYCPARCHGSFRWNLAYSGGRLTDWGAHLIDLAQWANDTETTGPIEVVGTGTFPPREALRNTATDFDIDYKYANGVTLNVSSSQPGIRFEGSEGWVGCEGWRATLTASDDKILASNIGPDEIQLHRPRIVIAREDGGKGGEHRNFIDCVKSREPCYAPAETGHRTISIAHIGNIALLLGRKLKWDPSAERFDNDAANQMLSRRQREPWTIENIDSWI
ncbi:MAG: Gfo/Idh/MocA family oxidoreductase [Pirellulales bacterium]